MVKKAPVAGKHIPISYNNGFVMNTFRNFLIVYCCVQQAVFY